MKKTKQAFENPPNREPVDLGKILTDKELRRIFGYEAHDQVTALNSPIKEAIEKAFNCRLTFESVSGTQQQIKVQVFREAADERGRVRRKLLNIVNELLAYTKSRKPTELDLNNLKAKLEERWSSALSLGDSESLEITLGRPAKSFEKTIPFREKRSIRVRIYDQTSQTYTPLSDDERIKIRNNSFDALELLQAEVILAPLRLDDAQKIIRGPVDETPSLVQTPAPTLKASNRYLLYVQPALVDALDAKGNPPEDITVFFEIVAKRMGVDIFPVLADHLGKKLVFAPRDDGLPNELRDLEALLTSLPVHAKEKESKKRRRQIEGKIRALRQFEERAALPPSDIVALTDESAATLVHRTLMDTEAVVTDKPFAAFMVGNRIIAGKDASGTNAGLAVKILGEILQRWASHRRALEAYPDKLKTYDLPRRIMIYNAQHSEALAVPIKNNLATNGRSGSIELIPVIERAFLSALQMFERDNAEPLDAEGRSKREIYITAALQKADPHLQDSASIMLARSLIEANIKFLQSSSHPEKIQPSPPQSSIPAFIDKAFRQKVGKPASSGLIEAPAQTRLPPDPQRAAEALTRRAERLDREKEAVLADFQAFVGGTGAVIPCVNKEIFQLVTNGTIDGHTLLHIDLINREFGINLGLPPKSLRDTFAIKIPDNIEAGLAEQVQLVLSTLVQRAIDRMPQNKVGQPTPITSTEVKEIITDVRAEAGRRRQLVTQGEFSIASFEVGDIRGYSTRHLPKEIADAFNNETLLGHLRAVFHTDFAILGKGDTLGYRPTEKGVIIGIVIERMCEKIALNRKQIFTQTQIKNLAIDAEQIAEISTLKRQTSSGKAILTDYIPVNSDISAIDHIIVQHSIEDTNYTPHGEIYFSAQDPKALDSFGSKGNSLIALLSKEAGVDHIQIKGRRMFIVGKEANVRRAISYVQSYIKILGEGTVMPDSPLAWREQAMRVAIGDINGDKSLTRNSLLDLKGREPGRASSGTIFPISREHEDELNSYQIELGAAMQARSGTMPAFKLIFNPGPAGTSKTWTVIYNAIKLINDPTTNFETLVLLSHEPSGGALPGDFFDKTYGQFHLYYQHLEKHFGDRGNGTIDMAYGKQKLRAFYEKGLIRPLPYEQLRGHNIENTIILFDEAQNAEAHVAKTAISRGHQSSIVVIMGDPAQCDLARHVDRMQRDLSGGNMGNAHEFYRYPQRITNVPENIVLDGKRNLVIELPNGKQMIFPDAHEQAKFHVVGDEIRTVIPYNSMSWLAMALPVHSTSVSVQDFTHAPRLRNPFHAELDDWFAGLKAEPEKLSTDISARGTRRLPTRPTDLRVVDSQKNPRISA